MSKSTIVRGVKVAGAVAVGVALTASVGSAAAAPSAPAAHALAAPAAVSAEPAPVAAVEPLAATAAVPTSWRGSVVDTQAAAQRPSRAAARQAVLAKQATFTRFTLTSPATKDMRGVEKSLYRGKFYNAAAEKKRLCIVERESEGHYDVVNPSGAYRGAYQVSASLARGATWMMLKEHRKLMGATAAKKTLAKLRSKPMNTWPRYWQDAAFHTVINWERPLSGSAHWAGGRWHC